MAYVHSRLLSGGVFQMTYILIASVILLFHAVTSTFGYLIRHES